MADKIVMQVGCQPMVAPGDLFEVVNPDGDRWWFVPYEPIISEADLNVNDIVTFEKGELILTIDVGDMLCKCSARGRIVQLPKAYLWKIGRLLPP